MGRAAEARVLAEEIALDPKTAAAHEALAVVAMQYNKPDEALSSLVRAVELPGVRDYGQFLFDAALLWQKAQDEASLETAERAFTRAVEMNTSYAEAYDVLASVMSARGAPLAQCLPLALRDAPLEPKRHRLQHHGHPAGGARRWHR